ncbi:XRCC4-like factor-domain-containing protein [Cercophora newfieldiana]|uniref:Non-homologous end-joining factor 1 n=1 Tax=Cercophora newfieldiana TaxID=92897 RepID=A0AA39YSL3_9PEZI|nr:XRCC4-like factor-domain-containing protein [Cercophora newfieldiana]
MTAHLQWRLLPGADPSIPTLLVSANFTAESYTVQITDLTNVWVESLDRKPIIKRGLIEDTSIDPSDGPDQLRRMTELIRAAFDINDSEHGNTSLSIGQGKDDALALNITCMLPKPLKPFKWPMLLAKRPHSSIATQVVLPLIMNCDARAREIDKLVAALREKDGVITRLVDKLEATGMGLEHVFNTLSGKRRLDRATAEKKVKGLAPFLEAEFRQEAGASRAPAATTDIPSLLNGVFGGTGLNCNPGTELEVSPTLDDWWTNIGKGKTVVLVERPRGGESETPLTTQTVRAPSSAEDDDFQVQSTPPGLSSARNRGINARPNVDDDDTTDGEDDATTAENLLSTARGHQVKPSGTRLGAIGAHKPPRRQPSPSPPRMTPPAKSLAKEERASSAASDTASDDDGDSHQEPQSPRSPQKPAQRRGGLGRIGGRPNSATNPVIPRSPTAAEKADTPPRKHKLGVIGRQTLAAPSPQASDHGEGLRGRSGSPAGAATKAEAPRETSQERADRKRAELQRDLERKAAAGPAKKKRKF